MTVSPLRLLCLLGLSLSVSACGDKEGGSTGNDDTGDDTTDTAAPDTGLGVQADCTLAQLDRLVFDRTGGDSVSLTLYCVDADAVSAVSLDVAALGVSLTVAGAADADGVTWRGTTRALDAVDAEVGTAYAAAVTVTSTDGSRLQAPPGTHLDCPDTDGACLRFHDGRSDFAETVPAAPAQHLSWALDVVAASLSALDTPSDASSYDPDADGVVGITTAWFMTASPGAGTLGFGTCDMGDDSDCTIDPVFSEVELPTTTSTNAIYGAAWPVAHARHALCGTQRTCARAVSTVPGASVGISAIPGATAADLYAMVAQSGSVDGATFSVPYDTVGLAQGAGALDTDTAPLVLGLHYTPDPKASGAASVVGALRASGVGVSAKDGSPVFWGASFKAGGSTPSSTWLAGTDWTTILPGATAAIQGLDTDLVVFFGGTSALEAVSIDAATGKTLSTVRLGEVALPLQSLSSVETDLDEDGIPELVVAVVDAKGALTVFEGELSASSGFARLSTRDPLAGQTVPWNTIDGTCQERTCGVALSLGVDGNGNIGLSAALARETGISTWMAVWLADGTGTARLDSPPDTVELLSLASGATVDAWGADCTSDAGFCGVLLRQGIGGRSVTNMNAAHEHALRADGGGMQLISAAWSGAEARQIPLVAVGDRVVTTQNGEVWVYDRDGRPVAGPLPLDPTAPLSAARRGDEIVLFGSTGDVDDLELEARAGDLLVVTVDADGGTGVLLLKAGGDFKIPEKVVMEKDDDFYGKPGASGTTGAVTGLSLSWTARSDMDGDGRTETATFQLTRLDVADLPAAGIQASITPGSTITISGGSFELKDDASFSLAGAYGGLGHPLGSDALGSSAVMLRRGRAKKRAVAPDPRYGDQSLSLRLADMSGTTTVAVTAEALTDDLVAVVPWDTGAACPLATVLVPGLTLDWKTNAAGAVVLATGKQADCSDLAVPVGAMDTDGDGVRWPVLGRVDAEAGTTTFQELVSDGEHWLLLPGVTVEATAFAGIAIGDADGDGLQDLVLRPTRRGDSTINSLGREALVLPGNGRSLAPLDADGLDFSADNIVSFDAYMTASGSLSRETRLDVVDSQDEGLSSAGQPLFFLVDDLGGLAPLGGTRGSGSGLSTCREQDEDPGALEWIITYASTIDPST